MTHLLPVSIAPTPGSSWPYTVTVDGHDISRACRGLTLRLDAESFPGLELNLCVMADRVNGDMVVRLAPDVHDALVALGWTPPSDGGEDA